MTADWDVMEAGSRERMRELEGQVRDLSDLAWAAFVGYAHWWRECHGSAGTFRINRRDFATEVDEFGMPRMTAAIRKEIGRARLAFAIQQGLVTDLPSPDYGVCPADAA